MSIQSVEKAVPLSKTRGIVPRKSRKRKLLFLQRLPISKRADILRKRLLDQNSLLNIQMLFHLNEVELPNFVKKASDEVLDKMLQKLLLWACFDLKEF